MISNDMPGYYIKKHKKINEMAFKIGKNLKNYI